MFSSYFIDGGLFFGNMATEPRLSGAPEKKLQDIGATKVSYVQDLEVGDIVSLEMLLIEKKLQHFQLPNAAFVGSYHAQLPVKILQKG